MEVIKVESWQPDYTRTCANCDVDHVVTGVAGGKVVYQGDMCGCCTWGRVGDAGP